MPSQWMAVLNLGMWGALYLNIMFWLPYFNYKIGNGENSKLIAIVYPLGLVIGTIVM